MMLRSGYGQVGLLMLWGASLPDVEYSSWEEYERCLPHAQSCIQLIAQWQLTSEAATRLLYQTAVYLVDRARYAEAEPLFQRALLIREQTLDPGHYDVALTLNGLANLYRDQGRYALAEPLYQRALHIWEQALSPTHHNIQRTRGDYASLLRTLGRNEEARKLEEGS